MALPVQYVWLIPALPLLAAGIGALTPRGGRTLASGAAIGAMVIAFILSCGALATALATPAAHATANFAWFDLGGSALRLGWVLDPLAAFMLVMVTFVGLLIFIFSLGYMHEDENFTRFFCFLSLFAAAMLGVVIANSLLLLFIAWELVGLASYLLIGFWFHKPEAAAAAKKAFITTRIGDLGLLLVSPRPPQAVASLVAHTLTPTERLLKLLGHLSEGPRSGSGSGAGATLWPGPTDSTAPRHS